MYADLHRMARRELAKRGAGMTLGATTLLHEAYLKLSTADAAWAEGRETEDVLAAWRWRY